jgi:UDP-3-O-[3-hydroxymyristoyl] glucosamine N-acyltransferase
VVIHSGAVIGKDGFGFAQRDDGRHQRIPQVGGVVIGDDVEVGALSTVARGAIEDTVVGDGSKIDDHCHVAHGCRLGRNVLLIGYARIGGSVEIGDNAYLLQDTAVSVGRKVGERAILGSGARVLNRDVGPGERVAGHPARPLTLTKRIDICLRELPDYRRRLRRLEERVRDVAP